MALSKPQGAILQELAASPLVGRFYWTGGTLLAEKYLHHRASYDVDLFSDQPVCHADIIPLVRAVQTRLGLKIAEEKKVFDRWEFFLRNHMETRFKFVHYDFPALKPRRKWRGVLIDSLEDLAANKTMALIDRHEPKDVVDIYFLIQAGFNMKKLLRLARKKFEVRFDETSLLSEILFSCKQLLKIRAMLNGSEREQHKALQSIEDYFKRASAKHLRRYW